MLFGLVSYQLKLLYLSHLGLVYQVTLFMICSELFNYSKVADLVDLGRNGGEFG